MVDLLGQACDYRAPHGAVERWAKRYGYGKRQIKNWIAAGKAAGDLPPFEEPERMLEWLERHYERVPARFASAVGEMGKPAAPEIVQVAVERFEMPQAHAGEGSLEIQIAGYQREWALLGKLREAALTKEEFSKASNYLTQQQNVSAELRQLERLLPSVLEQRGDFQRTSEVRAAVTDFLTVLKRNLMGRAPAASARLRSAPGDAELQAAWRDEINAVFAACCSQKFADPLVLS
jgi:hypothetical protein